MGGWAACGPDFDSDDPEFFRGMEAGYVYGLLDAKPAEPLTTWVLASNEEMMRRIAAAAQRTLIACELDQPSQNQPRLEVSFGEATQ